MDKIILTKETARYWAIKKWEYIVANNGDESFLQRDIPELAQFNGGCSYCSFYGFNNAKWQFAPDVDCNRCHISLVPEGKSWPIGHFACTDENHPFLKYNQDETLENAQAVLDLILNSPDKE